MIKAEDPKINSKMPRINKTLLKTFKINPIINKIIEIAMKIRPIFAIGGRVVKYSNILYKLRV
jgi:hypothetical protein